MNGTCTITPRHGKDTMYDSLTDCPLRRALKQQYPMLNVSVISDEYFEAVFEGDNLRYTFDRYKYSRDNVIDLKAGRLKEIILEFKYDEKVP